MLNWLKVYYKHKGKNKILFNCKRKQKKTNTALKCTYLSFIKCLLTKEKISYFFQWWWDKLRHKPSQVMPIIWKIFSLMRELYLSFLLISVIGVQISIILLCWTTWRASSLGSISKLWITWEWIILLVTTWMASRNTWNKQAIPSAENDQ